MERTIDYKKISYEMVFTGKWNDLVITSVSDEFGEIELDATIVRELRQELKDLLEEEAERDLEDCGNDPDVLYGVKGR